MEPIKSLIDMETKVCPIYGIDRFLTTKVQKLMDVARVPLNEINELNRIVFVLNNGKEYKASLEEIRNDDNTVIAQRRYVNVQGFVIVSKNDEEMIPNLTEEPSDYKRENTLRAKMLMMFITIALKNEFQFSNIKYEYDLHGNKFYTDYFVTRNTKRNEKNDGIYRFFHIKYETRIGKMITLNDLRQTYSDYSIRKYFHSFCKAIEGNPNFENNLMDFNIITNTEFDSIIEYFKEEPLKKDDEFLFIKEGAKVCTFNSEKFKELKNIFFASEEKNDKKIKLFLKKFKFITNYPREDYIDSWIKYELKESFYLLNSNLMSSTSDQSLSDILKTKFEANDMEFLTLEKGKEFLDNMKNSIESLIISSMNKDYIDQLQSFGVSFEMGEKDEIYKLREKSSEKPIVLSSECTQLTVIKFLQAYEKDLFDTNFNENGYIFMQAESLMFQREREIVKTFFCSKDGPNLLLIEYQHESISQDEFEYIFGLCVQWLPKNSKKKCIFIINDQYKYKDADRIEIEQICFKHLTQKAKKHVMKKPVNFQGMLEDHLNVDEANEMIDSNCLWQILSEQIFEL